jgi:hypothetical protein
MEENRSMGEGSERKGFHWVAAGFILALAGFAVILWSIWSTGTIPLNTTTFSGVGVAGLGIAVGAIGLDRGVSVKG